ncbi:MAG: hypothetical protein H6766_06395 [Candidatus Peribacteria bacterium]|nr:MAG: hypothetical protein H6766_06395 [Candidatus Peribacteria bacterium]
MGDYSESAVSYVMDMDQHILSLMGDVGGESVLTIIILYDPDRVQLISVDTNYQYIVQDDDM